MIQMEPEQMVEDQVESELDEDEIRQKGDWNQQLYLYIIFRFKACQRGDLQHVRKCIDKRGNVIQEDRKKWSPLIWSSCKGYTEIVRLLISRGAAAPYATDIGQPSAAVTIYASPTHQGSTNSAVGGAFFNASMISRKVTMGVINPQVKSTPLQWACFKGHLEIVWLLLREGLSWEDVDQFGNNSVHLAASGGSFKVFETLLFLGVAIDRPNTRGHTPKDLATNLQIIQLIKTLETSKQPHFCLTCRQFYPQDQYRLAWVFENADSTDTEKPEGRCIKCWDIIAHETDSLLAIMEKQDHKLLTDKLHEIEVQKIEIDPKTMRKAFVEQEKLRTQNIILDFIATLKVVPNYKTILKAVNQITSMLEDAVNRNVLIDDYVKEIAHQEMERLIAERNLQFCLDNMDAGQAIPENVAELNDKVEQAQNKKVAQEYIQQASELRDKMAKSIKAKKLLLMFNQYPMREIPDPIKIDPKTKKPIDPITNKPMEPLKLALQNLALNKKKKKDPKFIIPDWCTDVKQLNEAILELENLLKESEVLNLSKEFNEEAVLKIKHMKNESRYRKQCDDEAKLIADDKAAQKKKNK